MEKQKWAPIRGFRDITGDEIKKIEYLRNTFYNIANLYNCQMIETPTLERCSLSVGAVGEESDIVHKEMYSFVDKDHQKLVLRPEITASVCRFMINNSLPKGRFSYCSKVFRRGKPQLLRHREFYQIGTEFLGENNKFQELDNILFAIRFLKCIGVLSKTKLVINNLGSPETQKIYTKIFYEYLKDNIDEMSELSQLRMKKNPLRIWDSKEECDRKLLIHAPLIKDFLTEEEKNKNSWLLEKLKEYDVDVEYDSSLVRGLDYYNGIVFEFVNNNNLSVLAGGRYDTLIERISEGHRKVSGIGWAAGVERLISLLPELEEKEENIFYVCSPDEEELAHKIVEDIRNQNYQCNFCSGSNIKKQLHNISKEITPNKNVFFIIIGSEEKSKNYISIKNMKNKIQRTFPMEVTRNIFTVIEGFHSTENTY